MHASQVLRWRGMFAGAITAARVLFAANSSSAVQATLDVELDSGLLGLAIRGRVRPSRAHP